MPYTLLWYINLYILRRTVEETEHSYRWLTQLIQQLSLHSNTKMQKLDVEWYNSASGGHNSQITFIATSIIKQGTDVSRTYSEYFSYLVVLDYRLCDGTRCGRPGSLRHCSSSLIAQCFTLVIQGIHGQKLLVYMKNTCHHNPLPMLCGHCQITADSLL